MFDAKSLIEMMMKGAAGQAPQAAPQQQGAGGLGGLGDLLGKMMQQGGGGAPGAQGGGGLADILGKLGGAGGLGWSNTNEGKVVAAAMLDAVNKTTMQAQKLAAKTLPPEAANKAAR